MSKRQKTLIIIAAGNGTRMGYLPKAISLIGGVPNLYNTVSKALPHFDKIHVISNSTNKGLFAEVLETFNGKITVHTIESGRGCGHAVLESLRLLTKNDLVFDDFVMCWGDVYFETDAIFIEILKQKMTSDLLIPLIEEKDPYVWFSILDETHVGYSFFSKNKEVTDIGYHDQSIFRFNGLQVSHHLGEMHNTLDKNGKYMFGSELIFLNMVNFMFNKDIPASYYVTKHKTVGYNTHDELVMINDFLKKDKK